MSGIFHRDPYAVRRIVLPRKSTMVMAGMAFAAGIGCTVALSNLGPKQAAPNPWAPEAAKATRGNVARVATTSPAPATTESNSTARSVASASVGSAPPAQSARASDTARASDSARAPDQVRVIGGDRVTPAPRAPERLAERSAPERNWPPIVARDDSADTAARTTAAAKRSGPMPLNDYEREALAKQAAAKANAELAGGAAGSSSTPRLSAVPSTSVDNNDADANRTEDSDAKRAEAAEKARVAKARKAARERQAARARRQEQDMGVRRYDDGGYRSGPAYAQDSRYSGSYGGGGGYSSGGYGGGGGGGFFRPGGIW